MEKVILVIASLMFNGMLLAQETYKVNLTIHRNGELLGSPSLVVETNKEASTSVSELYNISFKIEPRDGEKIHIPFNLNMSGKDYAGSLTVTIDSETSIEFGEMKLFALVSKAST